MTKIISNKWANNFILASVSTFKSETEYIPIIHEKLRNSENVVHLYQTFIIFMDFLWFVTDCP